MHTYTVVPGVILSGEPCTEIFLESTHRKDCTCGAAWSGAPLRCSGRRPRTAPCRTGTGRRARRRSARGPRPRARGAETRSQSRPRCAGSEGRCLRMNDDGESARGAKNQQVGQYLCFCTSDS